VSVIDQQATTAFVVADEDSLLTPPLAGKERAFFDLFRFIKFRRVSYLPVLKQR
jgi:hypothetical protein